MDDRLPPHDAPVAAGARERSLARNVVTLLASQSMTWLIGTALVLVQPRLLGPTQVGRLQLATSIWAIATVLGTWGTTNVLLVDVARDPTRARPLTRAVERFRAVSMTIVAVPVAVFAFVAGYPQRTIAVIALVGVSSWVLTLAMSRRSTLLALEEVGAVGSVDVALKVLQVAVVLTVLLLGADAEGVAAVGIAVSVVGFVLFGRALVRRAVAAVGDGHVHGRGLLHAGRPYFFIDATTTMYLQIDTIVISLLVGEEQLGWYSVASFAFASLLFVPTIMMSALFPTFARGHAQRPEDAEQLLVRLTRLLLVLGVWVGIGTVVVSRPLTSLLFGDRFDGAAPVLAVYGLVAIVSYQTIALSTYAITTDRAAVWTKLMVVAIAGTVVLDLVLVPVMRDRYDNGALAGPTSYVITEMLQLVVGVALLARHLLSRRTLLHVLRVAAAGLASYVVGIRFEDEVFVVPAIAASAAYLLVLVGLGGIDADDRRLLRSAIGGRFTRA